MRRREFVQILCAGACGALGALAAEPLVLRPLVAQDQEFYKEALFYEKLDGGMTRCLICPRKCVVGDKGRGHCRVRENRGGRYYSAVYERVCTYHVDPIEKKPLFHFLPGTTAYSLATVGCNLSCKFCQNWEISQASPEEVDAVSISPGKVADSARKVGAPTISYTYTEPTVFYEYMFDTAAEGHKIGIKSVMISNGFINRDPLLKLTDEMDAIKVDLKSFTESFYSDVCSASLKPVLDSMATVRKSGTWLEIVNLVIPTLNDDEKDIDLMAKWIAENVGDEVPLHFTRFYPMYKLVNLPPTSVTTVERAREIAMARGLKYVYVGNVPTGHPGESTYCPGCGTVVIKRAGYTVLSMDLVGGKCPKCGRVVPGVWS